MFNFPEDTLYYNGFLKPALKPNSDYCTNCQCIDNCFECSTYNNFKKDTSF